VQDVDLVDGGKEGVSSSSSLSWAALFQVLVTELFVA